MQQEVEYGQTGIMAIHGRALSVLSCERNSDIAIELGSVMTEPGYSSVGLSSGGDGRNTDFVSWMRFSSAFSQADMAFSRIFPTMLHRSTSDPG